MDPVRLAIDVGPLYGHRTGIGAAVAELIPALDRAPGRRAAALPAELPHTPEPPARRLPLPAALAHRLWARSDTLASTGGSARPRSCTAPTTSSRRAGGRRWCRSTTAGSWPTPSWRRPTSGAPARCCGGACRGRDRAHVEPCHRGPAPGPARRARRRGRPPRAAPRRRAAGARPRGVARRARRAARTCSPSARSSGARTCPPSAAFFAAAAIDAALVIAGAPGDDTRRARHRRRALPAEAGRG